MKQGQDIEPAQVAQYWWMTLIVGIVFVGLSSLMFLQSGSRAHTLVTLLGLMWLVSGVFAIVEVFFLHRRKRRTLSLVVGLISVGLGLAVLVDTVGNYLLQWQGSVIVIGLAAFVVGVIQIVAGQRGARIQLLLGIVNVIVGAGLVFFRESWGSILVIVFGALLLVGGVVLIWYSFWLRKQGAPASASD